MATETSYRKASRWGEEVLATMLSLWRTVQERGQQAGFTSSTGSADRLELDSIRGAAGLKPRTR